jgi:hypothetical protein
MGKAFLMGALGALAVMALFQIAPKLNPIPKLPVALK